MKYQDPLTNVDKAALLDLFSQATPEQRSLMLSQVEELKRSSRMSFLTSPTTKPLEWVQTAFDWGVLELKGYDGPDAWQQDILTAIGDGIYTLDQALRIAVASGHGIGKSALVSWIILWSLSTHPDTKGVVTANTEMQLKTKTWAELAKWHRLCATKDMFTFAATAIFSSDPTREKTWRIDMIPWSLVNTEAFAGLHNQGKRIILIYDEASAIPDAIWEVSEGALTDKDTQILWCCFGNPTRNTGRFRECFGRHAHRWQTRQIDSRSSRFANTKQIEEWAHDWGENSDFFRVRVRGEFPGASDSQFISSADVEAARKRTLPLDETLPKVIACDVARYGDDQTVIGMRQGRVFKILACLRSMDNVEVAERLIEQIEIERPEVTVVDADGLGAGVVDQLRHRGYRPFEFHGGAKPRNEREWFNKRTEAWADARNWLQGEVSIPDDPELAEHLTGPSYGFPGIKGAALLEKKSDMKRRGLSSPDKGDTLAMTFAVQCRRAAETAEEIAAREDGTGGLWFGSRGAATSWMR